MSNNININFSENDDPIVTSFEENMILALRRLMRTALAYADDLPTHVYMYTQMTEETAFVNFLFKVNGKIVEANALNKAKLKGHTFDVSEERQMELQGYIAGDMGERLLPLFYANHKKMPNEIYAWIDVSEQFPKCSLIYNYGKNKKENPDLTETISEWKKQLENPESVGIDSDQFVVVDSLLESLDFVDDEF